MIYLLLTILVSSFIYVIFKNFDRYNVNTFQAIVTNYLVCAIIGFFLSGFTNFESLYLNVKPVLYYAIALSVLFIVVFNFIGMTAQKFGISIASLADKVSLVIPVFFAFILLKEAVTIYKVIGIVFSLLAIVFIVSKSNSSQSKNTQSIWYYPLIVFVGGGFVGTLLKLAQHYHASLNYSAFLVFSFGIAFLIGLIVLLFGIVTKRVQLSFRSIVAGIVLGIPNYFSLYWFLKALAIPNWESSVIFPINNIGILLLTTIFGVFLFKEKLLKKNWIGLILALFSILILIFETLYV